jgi:peptidoglycan/xylan/chitin deacetylase (PgdA/CDA1 family)
VALALVAILVAGLALPSSASTTAAPCSRGQVSLTFDSGPVRGITDQVLDILARNNVKATFFVLGRRIADAPDLVARMTAEGHAVANHSWSHRDMPALTDDEIRTEISTTQDALVAAGAKPLTLFRPPSGHVDARVAAVIASTGMRWVTWTVSSADWAATSVNGLVSTTVSRVRPFKPNTILLHDGNPNSGLTVQALPAIISRLRTSGYCFTTLTATGAPAYVVPQVAVTTTPGAERRRKPVKVTLTLDRPTSRAVPLTISTADGTALAGRDYRPVRRTVWVKPGQRRVVVQVPVLADTKHEPAEHLLVRLQGDSRSAPSTTPVKAWITSP